MWAVLSKGAGNGFWGENESLWVRGMVFQKVVEIFLLKTGGNCPFEGDGLI